MKNLLLLITLFLFSNISNAGPVIIVIEDGFGVLKTQVGEVVQSQPNEIYLSLIEAGKISLSSAIPFSEDMTVEIVNASGETICSQTWNMNLSLEIPCSLSTNTVYYLRLYNSQLAKSIAFQLAE